MKKFISLLCALSMLLGCVPVYADSPEILVNEGFDNIATNAAPENITVKTGLDARVVSLNGKNKALYAKADGCSVKINVPVETTYPQTVISYDIMLEGAAVKGEAMSLSSSSASKAVLAYNADRSISLDDGMDIGGYASGVWTNYAAVIDFTSSSYDLYINGVKRYENRRFYSKPPKTTSINFSFSCLNAGDIAECYLDNIRVYEGSVPLPDSAFPSKGYNSEEIPFSADAAEEQVFDTIFVDSYSKQGMPSITFTQKEDTTAGWESMEEGGAQYMHFAKTGTNDTYANVKPEIYDGLTKYVWQIDVFVSVSSCKIVVGRANESSDKYSNLLYVQPSGDLTVGDIVVGKMEYGKWVTLAVACNLLSETVAVYKNGELLMEDVPMHSGAVLPSSVTIGFTSGGGEESEVWFNKIKMYDGLTLRTFDDTAFEGTDNTVSSIGSTVLETDDDAHKMLGKDNVFMTSNGKFYANGEKLDYASYGKDAYLDGDKVMVDVNVLSYALGIENTVSGGMLAVGENKFKVTEKDGANFVNAADVARSMGKYVYDTDNREFILISDSSKNYSNGILSEDNQEDIDLIWRFMQFDRPSGEEMYEALINGTNFKTHPRVFVKKEEIPELRNRINNNTYMKTVLNQVIDTADSLLEAPVVKRELEGIRLFNRCNDVKENLFDLCTVYLLTGDKKYAERAWLELENACNWEDWNLTQHFLDSGEMGTGIAYAYDVLYDYLTEEQKAFVREKVTKLYLDFCVNVYTGQANYKAVSYRNLQTNWGALCSASMLTIALAFMDEEDADSLLTQKCKFIAENSLQNFEYLATVLAPDGTWYEGMGYYEYTEQHFGWVLEALDNIFGEDYNFLSANGIREFPMFAMYYETINGSFNKADTTGNKTVFAPAAMIYAKLCDEPELMGLYDNFRKTIGITTFKPQYLLFYDPEYAIVPEKTDLSLDKYYSTIGTGIMRGSWEDPESLYIAISGGRTIEVNDSHYDKGSFIFESLGERWSIDLGRNANNQMPFVKRTETHSALVINPDVNYTGQELYQTIEAVKVESKARGAQMVYDLAPAYGSAVTDYKRGFLVSDDRNTLTVQDELTLTEKSELVWNMITKADIEISADGKSAVLTQNGKKLLVTAYCSEDGWRFEKTADMEPTGGWVDNVMSAEAGNRTFTIEEQKTFSADMKKLQLKATGNGDVRISVKLAPEIENESFSEANATPMSEWTIPDGEIPPKPMADAIYADGKIVDDFVPGLKKYTLTYPYGTAIPTFTADVPRGTVEIKQPASFTDAATVTVTLENGKKATYTIDFIVTERVTDALMDVKPTAGLPANAKLIDVVSSYATHEPQPEHHAGNIADGNLNTAWTSDMKGAYIELDLGAVYDLSGIAFVFSEGSNRNYVYDILVSENKMDYKRIYSGDSTGTTDSYEFLAAPVKARYVRYIGNQNRTNRWNNIMEIRPVAAQ